MTSPILDRLTQETGHAERNNQVEKIKMGCRR